jgi:N-acetylglucosaminyldiphosphoundecaprenol N-acetyl-beta-D-mannosaminyltransferase
MCARIRLIKQIDACTLLGVRVHRLTIESLFDVITQSIETRTGCVVGHHNLHSVYLFHHDVRMRAFYDEVADYVFIDGMPLVFWGRVLGVPLTREHRFTSVDWLPLLMERCAAQGWRVFYLGGTPSVVQAGIPALQQRFPGLAIAARDGYFDAASDTANRAILDEVAAWSPDLLLVGMGMPRQEQWILAHRSALAVPCILPVGAALDYVTGAIPTPPRWLSHLGFEWLARLVAEPRRLARRYLVEPWFLVPYFVADIRGAFRNR